MTIILGQCLAVRTEITIPGSQHWREDCNPLQDRLLSPERARPTVRRRLPAHLLHIPVLPVLDGAHYRSDCENRVNFTSSLHHSILHKRR